MNRFRLVTGTCPHEITRLKACSFDSVVTDPPYHLTTDKDGKKGFMGKAWDGGNVAFRPETWAEVLRVVKPGAYLLAFGGTRTYHRLACAVEDGGWEIRDALCWLYGSGFPKSLDVSKAIDKQAGAEREVVGKGRWAGREAEPSSTEDWRIRHEKPRVETAPSTPEAQRWQGFGTALKPAMELIVCARKPIIGTVASNVQRYGTGALNIDGCRIPGPPSGLKPYVRGSETEVYNGTDSHPNKRLGVGATVTFSDHALGRWPANVLHDGSDEVMEAFAVFGDKKSGHAVPGQGSGKKVQTNTYGSGRLSAVSTCYGDTGSVARFFYCAKASKRDRGSGNLHPCVKPTPLMQWLCRLVTPPGGLVLDPFTGSGSTGVAALREGFRFVGIDESAEYLGIARRRLE